MNLTTMNKKNFLLILLLLNSGLLWAQAPGGRKLGSTYHTNNDTSVVGDIREKLVQLALQNPNFEIADRKISIAGYQLDRAKGDWLNVISPSINLNEFTIKPKTVNNQFLPLWNVGVIVPLNYYSTNKNATKVARENLYIAEAEKNERYREIRAKVLIKFEDYLMYKEMFELQSRSTQDAYLFYRQRENDFADNAIGVDDYNKAYAAYKDQQDRKVQAQRNLNVAKIEMEQMIGISIDEVLGKK